MGSGQRGFCLRPSTATVGSGGALSVARPCSNDEDASADLPVRAPERGKFDPFRTFGRRMTIAPAPGRS
jgi:hypothetical protein